MRYLIVVLGFLAFTAQAADFEIPVGAQCAISWRANPAGENVDMYDIAIGPIGGPVAHRTEVPEGLTIACAAAGLDTDVQGETWAEARAHNAYGWSEPSDRVSIGVGVPPSAPVIHRVRIVVTVTVRQEEGR